MEATLQFNPSAYGVIRQRELITVADDAQKSTLSDGTMICCDDNGRIQQAQYASGAKINRQATYCLVQAWDQSYWYGDLRGAWYPLD